MIVNAFYQLFLNIFIFLQQKSPTSLELVGLFVYLKNY
nr:MAG TPA: hypothetical protein [Bacteriophage sp.]